MTEKRLLILNSPKSERQGAVGDQCASLCHDLGIGLDYREINDAEEVLGNIVDLSSGFDGLIVNPGQHRAAAGAAVANLAIPVVEVHEANIFQDGSDVRPLYVPNRKVGFVCGLGVTSFLLAIKAVTQQLSE